VRLAPIGRTIGPDSTAPEAVVARSGPGPADCASAALLVIIVVLGFAAGRTLGIKEMGLALAIAVAVDATLVRCLLVLGTMTLLGNLNR